MVSGKTRWGMGAKTVRIGLEISDDKNILSPAYEEETLSNATCLGSGAEKRMRNSVQPGEVWISVNSPWCARTHRRNRRIAESQLGQACRSTLQDCNLRFSDLSGIVDYSW
jgi:hypothetical protein